VTLTITSVVGCNKYYPSHPTKLPPPSEFYSSHGLPLGLSVSLTLCMEKSFFGFLEAAEHGIGNSRLMFGWEDVDPDPDPGF